MSYVIKTDEMRTTAKLIHEAAEHFEKKRKDLARVSSEVSGKLTGGYGQTGGYQGTLGSFEKTFLAVLDELLEDEVKLVAFLDGLDQRIHKAAGIYDHNETEHAESYNRISGALDGTSGRD